MRTAVDNPFTPGSDVVPRIWAGRLDELRDWEDVVRPRRAAGLPERGRTILGEAGLGKSTLVRRIATAAAGRGDWVTPQVRIPLGTDPLKALSVALLRLADQAGLAAAREARLTDLLTRVRSIATPGVSVEVDAGPGPDAHTALTDLLVEIGEVAVRRDVTVLVHLDEVQNITDPEALSQLLICLGDAAACETEVEAPGGVRVTRGLPLLVYLTGLPDFADMAGARKGATFARRFATRTLPPLHDDDLRLALHPFLTPGWEVPDDRGGTTRVSMEPAAIEAIVARCCGEPFLFQLAGERAWYAGTGPVITADEVRHGWSQAREEASAHVQRILTRLPEREMQLVEVMAGLPPAERTLTRIAREMGFTEAAQAGPASRRLDTVRGVIDRGKPYTFRHRAIEAYLTTDWPDV